MGARALRGGGVVAAMAALGGLATGCGPTAAVGHHRPAATGHAHLVAYDSCSQLLDQVRSTALAELGPSGLPGTDVGYSGPGTFAAAVTNGAVRAAVPEAASAAAGAGASAGDASPAAPDQAAGSTAPFSTTNDQEAGVDEPDLAKTDGSVLVTVRRDGPSLEVTDVASSPPRLRGTLALGELLTPTGLLLVGGDAVVLGSGPWNGPTPVPEQSVPGATGGLTVPAQAPAPTTIVAVVSLADPDHPAVVRSFTLQGTEVDARLVAGTVEVVVASGPRLDFVAPADGSAQSQAAAMAANTETIRTSTVGDWLPSVTSAPAGTTRTAACTAAMHPDVASGLGTVSVVPLDPSSSSPGAPVTVVGDATTVYASASSLYVATTSWPQIEAQGGGAPSVGAGPGNAVAGPPLSTTPATTEIHGFDLSDPATPRYLGSGEVPGTLIGQYALSEYQGYLRVATTIGTATPPPSEGSAPATPSVSQVTVLQPQSGALVEVGSLTGLGTGEKIYAVRLLGSLGYVVTFRQTDPLYVLDLSDPRHPQASGQLELTGYSSFLEPLPGGRLLGIGAAVDPNLRTEGLQLSLFDVSDPAHPSLVAKDVLSGAWSNAGTDPHALLWWAPAELAVLPVTQEQVGPGPAGDSAPPAPFDGAVAFHVTGSGISEVGRVAHPMAPSNGGGAGLPVPGGPATSAPAIVFGGGSDIERSLVVGSMLYTVSEAGVLASNLSSFDPVTWIAYAIG